MSEGAAPVVAVATSGGRDSTALLHATARAALALKLRVVALHVHHGLMPEADAWVRHLQQQVARWARRGLPVSLCVTRLSGQPLRGDSVEAWARRGRYAALAEMARQVRAPLVLLAHHEADQAETFLLQALRIGSPAGLSAMPTQVLRDGLCWARPWLHRPRAAIIDYVVRHRLAYVDDASNTDARFARSRLRTSVLPALESAFPGAVRQLAQAAQRQQEAAACLQELADADLGQAADAQGALRLDAWLAFSAARRAHVLRRWLHGRWAGGVPETLVQRLCAELPASRSGARWPAPGAWVRRRGAVVCVEPARDARGGASVL